MRVRLAGFAALTVAAVLVGGERTDAQRGPYKKITEIKIGGSPSFDYLAVDAPLRRLYVSNSTRFVVIDIDKNTVVGSIGGDLHRVHGLAIVPGDKAFTSNGGDNNSSLVDLKTLQTLKQVDIGPGPDAILYEPKMNEVYAFNHSAGTATVVKGDTGAPVATIKLTGGAVETGVADPGLGRVFVNIESASEIDAIDVATHQVVAHWPVAPASGPSGLAIDPTTHHLFSGGGPSTVMIDAKTGAVVSSAKICSDTDATTFDPGTKYVFSSCGDGTVSIMKEDGDKLTPVQLLTTHTGARTIAVDPTTHNIYVVAADSGGRGQPAVPDSFRAFVFGMGK
jgi:DNA-binding beta-propeller fold protein YncE